MSANLQELVDFVTDSLKEHLKDRHRKYPQQERVKEAIRISYRKESGHVYFFRIIDDSDNNVPDTGRLIRMEMSDREDKEHEPFMAFYFPDENRTGKEEIDAFGITYRELDEELFVNHLIEYLLDGIDPDKMTGV